MSETEFLDLAPGVPISEDGSLRAFRYSQFSACPSVPFNTAEPEYLPSQFHLSASLETSSLSEFGDHNCMPNDGFRGGSLSSLLCSSTKSDALSEGEKCSSECDERLHPGASSSDSLGLSLFDSYAGFKKCRGNPSRVCCGLGTLEEETQVFNIGASIFAQQDFHVHSPIQDSPRRIYCDPRLLGEDTEVSKDIVVVSNQQTSRQLSARQLLQSSPQAFDSGCAISEVLVAVEDKKSILTTAAEPGKGLPLLAVKEGGHGIEDFDDTCQMWHSRRASPDKTAVPSSSNPSTATNQNIPAAVGNNDYEDIVRRWHNRKRVALSAITNLSSSSTGAPFKKLKQTSENVVESGTLHSGQPQSELVKDPLLGKENSSVPQYGHDRMFKVTIAPGCSSETTEEDVNDNDDIVDSCYSNLRRKLNSSCARGMKSFLQLVSARNEPSIGIPSTSESDMSKPQCAEKRWTCPRKNRPRGRQRTMDAWIK